ncbi:hypothetical protein GYMLUDRAFT_46492 [Collybiopsis luxurians FD-317 M1]|uniref:G domain-containing protein n=1 Tax=Collybiopsis luxurians FD-317 M1 TaxID=944289 RepID=A0A0D0C471_9AGAR|nr:hypothetical protein GYMLUDRAFT_46492 [Collybiopsis luxurians FD-317 M1]
MASRPRNKENFDNYPDQDPDSSHESSAEDDDVVIAVMGSTGSGKSSFIKLLSGDQTVKTGDSLESETIDVQQVSFQDEQTGHRIILVDTPGFDDSRDGMSDTEVLRKITGFLLDEYDNKRKLNGLIYIHSIASTRFSGQSVRNLKMFKSLCGSETYKNVVVLTTFWDDKSAQTMGEKREEELKSKFCKPLADGGATFMRHDRTIPSTQKVLQYILTLVPTNVQITKEIREEGKALENTTAGSVRSAEVNQLIIQHKAEISELQAQLQLMIESRDEMREQLAKETADMQRKLERLENEKAELSMGLDNEKQARQKLEQKARQEKDAQIAAVKGMEDKFDALERKRLEEEYERKLNAERIARKDAEEKLRRKEDVKGWGKLGLELAEDIPLVPNAIAKPFLGTLGAGVDLLSRNARRKRQQSQK